MNERTIKFNLRDSRESEIKKAVATVYEALAEKGYNPINQLVGYILSEDPTYITTHRNARNIISNIDLTAQYANVQQYEPATWQAFLRRIQKVIEYFPDRTQHEYSTQEYLNGFREVYVPDRELPFSPVQASLADAF